MIGTWPSSFDAKIGFTVFQIKILGYNQFYDDYAILARYTLAERMFLFGKVQRRGELRVTKVFGF